MLSLLYLYYRPDGSVYTVCGLYLLDVLLVICSQDFEWRIF